MMNQQTVKEYDAIIIGVGQAGNPLAFALAKAGWKTAVIEREHVGGTCVNEGCTPTKTMVASARVAYLARRGAEYGVQTDPVNVDLEVVRRRKQGIVDHGRNSIQQALENTPGIDLLLGEGRFTGPNTVEVTLNNGGSQSMTAPKIFINTGARPSLPPVPGLQETPYLTSTSIMELDSVPAHLLVMGGGYVGLEFAQMFRRFGSQVTLIQRGSQLLPREDTDVATEVAKILGEDGITVLLDTSVVSTQQNSKDGIELQVRTGADERTLTGSHLLVATGRSPTVSG